MKAHAAQPTCPRLFEVEALRDGRLSGAELTRFQSHVQTCSVCAQETHALRQLAEALRSPSPEADELHVRRERTRLLAAFDASLVPAAPSGGRSKLWLAAVALAALLVLLFRPAPTVTSVAVLEAVTVQAATTTKWSRRAENQLETITLEAGTLSISVDHQLPHRRLLVLLPDGELEDIGTTFSVSAAAARTTQVTVQDGSVILRLRGLPPLTLRAGDSWTPAAPAVPVSAAPPANKPPAPSLRSAKPPGSPASAASVGSDAANLPDPAADFRAAMSAFTGGDSPRAASLFAAFLGQHPGDSHAEDAAYLRVLALQRTGNPAAMQQAAVDYLRRYPRGFRRAEVEPLSR